jgi:hypothetical protein
MYPYGTQVHIGQVEGPQIATMESPYMQEKLKDPWVATLYEKFLTQANYASMWKHRFTTLAIISGTATLLLGMNYLKGR